MELRQALVMSVLRGQAPVAALCRQAGVSRKTAYKWLERFRSGGTGALADQSRARLSHDEAISDQVRDAVLAERRRHPTWGPKKLIARLERERPELELCSLSSAGRILKDAGLTTPQQRRTRLIHTSRSERDTPRAPNDIWTTDFKGQFPTQDGRLCFPLTIADLYSRYLLCVAAKESVKTNPVRSSFERIFREFGQPRVIRSDNGAPFAGAGLGRLSRLSVWWMSLGIELDRITPGRPVENGQHERMHRTLKAETTRPPGRDLREQQQKFSRFVKEYNQDRPHEGLGMAVPGAVYKSSPREYRSAVRVEEYPGHWLRRKVQQRGVIYWRKQQVFVSEPLAGLSVGLTEVDDGIWHLYYRTTLLGVLDEREEEPQVYDVLRG